MGIRQTSFAINGMFCAKCAVTIERALARLEGVIAAQVNFATERAAVVYNPVRAFLSKMVRVVQGEGFAVPLTRVVLNVNDLFYATSARTVERVLCHSDGVVQVEANLRERCIELDVLTEQINRDNYAHRLATLGLVVADIPSRHAIRDFGSRAALIVGLALLSFLSAGAHAGWFEIGFIHAPLVVMTSAVVIVYGIARRFYRAAFETVFHHGEFDVSAVTALVATLSLFAGLPLALIVPQSVFTTSGFNFAIGLTTGWFIVRGANLWLASQSNHPTRVKSSASQTAFGIVSHGSRD